MTNRFKSPEDFRSNWDNVVPVGRGFGSADYERLAELDHLAVQSLGSLEKARRWLDTPNPNLGGQVPELLGKTSEGFKQVKSFLLEFRD